MEAFSNALFRNLVTDISPYLDLSPNDGEAGRNHAVACANARSLLNSFYKKFEDDNEYAKAAAIALFRSMNDRCAMWRPPTEVSLDFVVLNEARSIACTIVNNNFDPNPIRHLFDGGLGSGMCVGSSGTSYYSKLFHGPLTCDKEVLKRIYNISLQLDPDWRDAEFKRSMGFGLIDVVKGSKISTVPKNREIARTICTEPTINMLYQKGVDAQLRVMMRKFFSIDLDNQADANRLLAAEGSRSQNFGTIDLKSASDTISLSFIRWFFSRYGDSAFLKALELYRCERTELPNGDYVKLHMISSMGNGFTFSLQSLIFASIVAATYRVCKIKLLYNRHSPIASDIYYGKDSVVKRTKKHVGMKPKFNHEHKVIPGNFGVFGDDIICTTKSYSTVCYALESAGFIVNHEKSFVSGPFRESCGFDAYLGINIRGVYVRRLKKATDIYSVVNRLNRWTARTGIPLKYTVKCLLGWFKRPPLYVPYDMPDDSGIRTLVPSPKTKYRFGVYWYKYMSPVQRGVNVSDGNPWLNPMGVLICALTGRAVGGRIVERQNDNAFVMKFGVTPNWRIPPRGDDGFLPPSHLIHDFEWSLEANMVVGRVLESTSART